MACEYSDELRAIQHELAAAFALHPRFRNVAIVAVLMDRRCACIATISDNPEQSRLAARHLEMTATLREADPVSPDFPRNVGPQGCGS
jgi:hypothetical protein